MSALETNLTAAWEQSALAGHVIGDAIASADLAARLALARKAIEHLELTRTRLAAEIQNLLGK